MADEPARDVMELSEFQDLMRRTYLERDSKRGVDATFRWLTEEIGEVARAIRNGSEEDLREEIGDALAWLTSLANLLGVEIDEAASRYSHGCPKCGAIPCSCPL